MKKLLLIGGLAGIGFSFFYFFKKQLDLVLDLEYSLKSLRIVELKLSFAKVKAEIEIQNKSSFRLNIEEYDIGFIYKGIPIARTQSSIPVYIESDSSFILSTEGDLDLKTAKSNLLPFISDVLKKRPIKFDLNGFVVVKFLNINYTIQLKGETVTYSANLLEDIGLEKGFDKLKNKFDVLLANVGIKN